MLKKTLAICALFAAVVAQRVQVEHFREELGCPFHHVGSMASLKGWETTRPAGSQEKIRLLVGVTQQNTDILKKKVLEVSDPASPDYGKHLSNAEVHALVAPKDTSVQLVMDWLAQGGATDITKETPNGDFIAGTLSIEQAERLLNTTYHEYEHPQASSIVRVKGGYSVPAALEAHIDLVAPTITFPPVKERNLSVYKEASSSLGPVTPDTLRGLYNITDKGSASKNIQGVASFLEQYINQKDLDTFRSKYSFDPLAFDLVPSDQKDGHGIEALLDVQYMSSTGDGIASQHWYTDGRQPGNPQNEPFLTFLANLGNTSNAPYLFSISYGDVEDGVSQDYAYRTSVEFQKAGARGITLLAASGDSGAGCKAGKFVPNWPASDPFITAVGGTHGGKTGSSPTGEECAGLSGGGFSNYFGSESYQASAVKTYLQQEGVPAQSFYNVSGQGYPDIAAQAIDFKICIYGAFTAVSGTSCASPSAGGIFGLLNDMRMQAGKSTLGFLNPLLYSIPSKDPLAFNDVVTGSNSGCSGGGFPAKAGWDAATGLGTPNYGRLKNAALSLN